MWSWYFHLKKNNSLHHSDKLKGLTISPDLVFKIYKERIENRSRTIICICLLYLIKSIYPWKIYHFRPLNIFYSFRKGSLLGNCPRKLAHCDRSVNTRSFHIGGYIAICTGKLKKCQLVGELTWSPTLREGLIKTKCVLYSCLIPYSVFKNMLDVGCWMLFLRMKLFFVFFVIKQSRFKT